MRNKIHWMQRKTIAGTFWCPDAGDLDAFVASRNGIPKGVPPSGEAVRDSALLFTVWPYFACQDDRAFARRSFA